MIRLFAKLALLSGLLTVTLTTAKAQWSVGIRNTRYAYVNFTLPNRISFQLEQSYHSEKIGNQTLRGYVGYCNNIRNFNYSGDIYFGMAYNRSFSSTGAIVNADYTLFNRIIPFAIFNPHYDSTLGYHTNWEAGTAFKIIPQISVTASYTTIPENRQSEKRIHAGFIFQSGQLSVTPRLSFNADHQVRANFIRVLFDMRYNF